MICTFCGTREDDAQALVVGSPTSAICDRCIEMAAEMVSERTTPVGDMVLDNIGTLATNDPRFPGTIGLVTDAIVAVRGDRIIWAGPAERMPQRLASLPRLDCGGRSVIPGLVDAHTHMLFGGDHHEEYALRAAGLSPREAAARAGGPAHTHRMTRRLTSQQLANLIDERMHRMLEAGTTTAEASSGYSDHRQHELDLLDLAGTVSQNHPLDLVATFDISRTSASDTDWAQDLAHLEREILPEVARLRYAVRVAYGEESMGFDDSRRLLAASVGLGTKTRLHCEDLRSGDPYRLALESKVTVIDHCGNVDRYKAQEMARLGISVVVTPIKTLAEHGYRTGLRDLIRAGVTVALGSDCSPVPVLVESLPLAISLSVLEMGLTPDQAIWSATLGGAAALGLPDRGWIGHGARADLVILDAPNPTYLSYRPDAGLIWKVIKNGSVVVSN